MLKNQNRTLTCKDDVENISLDLMGPTMDPLVNEVNTNIPDPTKLTILVRLQTMAILLNNCVKVTVEK